MSRAYKAPAIGRAIEVLQLLAGRPWAVSLSDLARELGYGKSTVLGVLRTLEEADWVARDPDSGHYRMGNGLLITARKAFGRWDLTEIARPSLKRLAEELGESAFLGFRRGDRVVVEDCVEGGHEMCVAARPGVTMPLLAGATGKVFLAGMDPEEVRAALGDGALPRFTDRTITDPGAFLREIQQTRERGYGLDDEEYLKGVRAAVAPVRCHGETVAALWVAGFSATLSDGRFAAAAKQLVREAEACGRLLEVRGGGTHDR